MVRVLDPDTLDSLVGQELGVSRWIRIDQSQIDAFAELTYDRQWIHVDVGRATRESAGTITHGFLTLSLMTSMVTDIWEVRGAKSAVNYGFDRLRFVAPVPSGARVRLREVLTRVETHREGVLLTRDCRIEIESQPKPAVVAAWLALIRV